MASNGEIFDFRFVSPVSLILMMYTMHQLVVFHCDICLTNDYTKLGSVWNDFGNSFLPIHSNFTFGYAYQILFPQPRQNSAENSISGTIFKKKKSNLA